MAVKKILVVEDEGVVSLNIRSLMKDMAYDVVSVVPSGNVAISTAKTMNPDLVLLDIQLQGEMVGVEAARQIQRLDIPVVLLIANSDSMTLEQAEVTGPFGYILKPIDSRGLHTSIEMALYRHGIEEELKQQQLQLEIHVENRTTELRLLNKLQKSVARYRDIVDMARVGIFVDETGGNISFCNSALADMLVVDISEIVGMPFQYFVHPDDLKRGQKLHTERLEHRRLRDRYEVRLRRADGSDLIAAVDVSILQMAGNRVAAVSYVRDITETKRLQQLESRALRLETAGQIAGQVAHDLNNILGPLVAYPELILRALPEDSAIRSKLEIMGDAAKHAADVIQDLLSMARRGRYQMTTVNLNQVIKDYMHSINFEEIKNRNPQVEVTVETSEEINNVRGSSSHLQKMIMNLVVNAYEAMPNGGALKISTSKDRLEKLYRGYDKIETGEYVILSLKDTGSGIAPEHLKKIFEPYFSTKDLGRSGSGLGMAVVYGILKDHKGYYDINSEVGKGTEFILYFPAVTENLQIEISRREDFEGSESILVVDDDTEQRNLAVELLSNLGYQVEAVSSGAAALEYLMKQSVDMVVLDMIMKKEFDGLDTYKEILKIRPGQQVVIVSGFSATDRVQEMRQLGSGSYVQKPYTRESIGRAVREELDRAAHRAPA